jgi:hypothetical protein
MRQAMSANLATTIKCRRRMVLVTLKWNKQSFENIPLDPAQGVEMFKSQIYSLTGQLLAPSLPPVIY